MDSQVELVAFRSACVESPGLLEELERHQVMIWSS